MDNNIDKNFLLALGYTTATENSLDPSAFLQKVEENQTIFAQLQTPKKPSKVKTHKRSDYI
jgi:hypothetical protein